MKTLDRCLRWHHGCADATQARFAAPIQACRGATWLRPSRPKRSLICAESSFDTDSNLRSASVFGSFALTGHLKGVPCYARLSAKEISARPAVSHWWQRASRAVRRC